MDGTPIPASALSHFGEPGLARAHLPAGRRSHRSGSQLHPGLSKSSLPANLSIVWSGDSHCAGIGPSIESIFSSAEVSAEVHIDKQLVVKNWYNWIHGEVIQPGQDDLLPTTDGLDNMRAAVQLDAGPHQITIEVDPDSSDLPMQVRLNMGDTVSAAEKLQSSGRCRSRRPTSHCLCVEPPRSPPFSLPGDQDRLIESVGSGQPEHHRRAQSLAARSHALVKVK